MAEAFADREVGQKSRRQSSAPAFAAYRERSIGISASAAWAAAACLDGVADPYEIAWTAVVACQSSSLPRPTGYVKTEEWRRSLLTTRDAGMRVELAAQANLLRDIFGNRFRPVAVDPPWLTPGVVELAHSIYEARAFVRMPVLADTLERAGCDNADMLAHCRQPGEHVRGCWVVEMILGKE